MTRDRNESADGQWAVIGYDGRILAGRWRTEALAVEHGLCGRYLLSGADVVKIEDAP